MPTRRACTSRHWKTASRNAEAALRLLEEDFERRAADLEGAPAAALETLGAQAELQQLWEMRTVRIDLIDGLRNLRDAELERLALADERLALLSSRADLRTIHQDGGFRSGSQGGRDSGDHLSPIARRPAARQRGRQRPGRNRQPDPARKSLLQLQSGDAIIRSSVRVGDLELIWSRRSARLLRRPGRRRLYPGTDPL